MLFDRMHSNGISYKTALLVILPTIKTPTFSSSFTHKISIIDDISPFYVENHDFLELTLGTLFSTHIFAKLHLGATIYGRRFVLLRRDYAPLLREFYFALQCDCKREKVRDNL